ncbi:MAG: hypothetical protein IPL46_12325 [Saprospiraceae bacterium]|nr:hypothetical protein [Saprospiraceae bacterium]
MRNWWVIIIFMLASCTINDGLPELETLDLDHLKKLEDDFIATLTQSKLDEKTKSDQKEGELTENVKFIAKYRHNGEPRKSTPQSPQGGKREQETKSPGKSTH